MDSRVVLVKCIERAEIQFFGAGERLTCRVAAFDGEFLSRPMSF